MEVGEDEVEGVEGCGRLFWGATASRRHRSQVSRDGGHGACSSGESFGGDGVSPPESPWKGRRGVRFKIFSHPLFAARLKVES